MSEYSINLKYWKETSHSERKMLRWSLCDFYISWQFNLIIFIIGIGILFIPTKHFFINSIANALFCIFCSLAYIVHWTRRMLRSLMSYAYHVTVLDTQCPHCFKTAREKINEFKFEDI